MAKTEGPALRIVATCFNCTHERSESYRAQGDSGHDVYCTHPKAPVNTKNGRAHVGDTRWDTPSWCPLLASARARLLATEEKRDG